MSNLDIFKTYLTNNQNNEAINFLNNTYFQGDKTYQLKVEDFGGDHAHAKTGGTESSPCITFKPAYLRRILTNPTNEEEVFAKCISTLRHERMHVAQLIKGEFCTKTWMNWNSWLIRKNCFQILLCLRYLMRCGKRLGKKQTIIMAR